MFRGGFMAILSGLLFIVFTHAALNLRAVNFKLMTKPLLPEGAFRDDDALQVRSWKSPCRSPAAWATAESALGACCSLAALPRRASRAFIPHDSLLRREHGDHQREPLRYGTLKHRAAFQGASPARSDLDTAAHRFLSCHRGNLTGKACFTAADVALGPVVAEGWWQAWDATVEAGPGELHTVTPREARAAAALLNVLLAVETCIACGEPREGNLTDMPLVYSRSKNTTGNMHLVSDSPALEECESSLAALSLGLAAGHSHGCSASAN